MAVISINLKGNYLLLIYSLLTNYGTFTIQKVNKSNLLQRTPSSQLGKSLIFG